MHPGTREISRFTYPLDFYNDFSSFKERFVYTSQSCSVALEDTSLDFELHLKKAKPKVLVVFLGGAKVKSDFNKPGPFFLGRSFSRSIEANMVFISDPTFAFDERIKLGWYLGTRKSNAQKAIKKLLDILCEILGVEFIVFFGGSGGGLHHFIFHLFLIIVFP